MLLGPKFFKNRTNKVRQLMVFCNILNQTYTGKFLTCFSFGIRNGEHEIFEKKKGGGKFLCFQYQILVKKQTSSTSLKT